MGEQHAALAEHAAVAVVQAVDRGVVLVVRAHGCQREYRLLARRAGAVHGQVGRDGMGDEGGAAAGGVPASFAGSVRQAEAAGHAHAGVEVVEVVEHVRDAVRSEEHTSELQSLMRISYAVFCLKKKTT